MTIIYRILIRMILFSMLAMLCVLAKRSYDSYVEYRDVDAAYDKQMKQVEQFRLELALLEDEKVQLIQNISYYEQLAREEFGMIKKDEKVYIVPLPSK